MVSKERKQPQRGYLLFCSDTAGIEQAHQNVDGFLYSSCLCFFFKKHRIQNPGPGSGCFPCMQKQEVAVGHICVLYTEE